MIKNDPVVARRRVYVRVTNETDGSDATRGMDFTDCSWIDPSTGSLVPTDNALTNNRRALTFTAFTFTADSATDQITAAAHGLETGDGPLTTTNAGGALPAPLTSSGGVVYYFIKIDDNTGKLAASLADAYAGTAIDLTTNGTGVQTLSAAADCQRGIDGDFTLQLDQAETNFDGDYLVVFVEKVDGGSTYRGRSFVYMDNVGSLWDQVLGADGATAGDMQRFNYCANGAGKLLRASTSYTLRNETDTKDRGHGTITEAGGRTEAVVDDATL